MLGKVISVAAVAACVYIALVVLVYVAQSHLVYFPTRALAATPQRVGLHYHDVFLETGSGIRIHGWHVPATQGRWTVLMLHGNGGNISHRLDTLRILNELGAGTLIIDYPGYGLSEGAPDERGTYDAAMAAWRYLSANAPDPGRIVVFGRSLGASVAAWLGARVDPAGLILESSFTSIADLARHHYPFLPVRLLLRYRYDAAAAAASIEAPTLVVHSPQDEIVPYALGRALFDTLPGRKRFLEIRGGHNDGFLVTGRAYSDGLRQFLESL